MKTLDKLLRKWRTNVALRMAPKKRNFIFDIGCDDGLFIEINK